MSTSSPAATNTANSSQQAGTATKPPSASLYVGDLAPEVTEGMLFELFNTVGPVSSIRVCRDTLTRRSLGYAYVNFHSVVDAERALDSLNNVVVSGKPCRIMWSQRDPSVRKTGVGNIFIKNLDLSIGHKELYDTFSQFGNILSCKVALDEKGESKGYGFVHFENQSAAESAVAQVNDNLMLNKKVYVGPFIPRKVRSQQLEKSWTNVFIKDLDTTIDDEALHKHFSQFGEVTSAVVMRKAEDQTHLGFGFVNFAEHEHAAKAVEVSHGQKLGNKILYCCRAQKKAEREARLKKEWEQLKISKYQGINLYIKNLEDEVDEERLRKEFSHFGTVKSCKIMSDEKSNSKGFGFVCYSAPEESQRAITEMNNRILPGCSKPLYVALHEPKEVRRQKLAMAAMKGIRGVPQGGHVFTSGQQPVTFYPAAGAASAMPGGQGFVYTQGGMMTGMPRGWQYSMHPAQGYSGTGAPIPRGAGTANNAHVGGNTGARGGQRNAGGSGGNQGARTGGNPNTGRSGNGSGNNNNRRAGGPPGTVQVGPQLGAPLQQMDAPQELTLAQLKHYAPDHQKLYIGERLYPLIAESHVSLAGKITGMFLDSGWTLEDLFLLLTDRARLTERIEEAIGVLERAQAGQTETEAAASAETPTA